jgi:hypothetical protein
MQTDDPVKGMDNTRDSAQPDRNALRKALDAAWSRLIHTRETTSPANATPADEKTTERHDDTDTRHDPNALHLW